MIYIAHRGNTRGRKEGWENSPLHILRAKDIGFDVEIDVFGVGSKLFLGHDYPQYDSSEVENIVSMDGIWCHAKNIRAMDILSEMGCHYFWHEGKDSIAMTSRGFAWCLANIQDIPKHSIAVLPEVFTPMRPLTNFDGVCSDDVESLAWNHALQS